MTLQRRIVLAALLLAGSSSFVAQPVSALDPVVTVAVDTGETLEYFTGPRSATLRAASDADGDIVAVGTPRAVTIDAPWPSNDTFSPLQWGIHSGGFDTLPARADGTGILVAVIDSGVLGAHQDLDGAVDDGGDYVSEPPQTMADPNGHGTHVAGIVAAHVGNNAGIAGAAGGATIRAYRVLDSSGSGTTDDIARAITQAVEDGAKVINLSLGGSFDPVVEAAVAHALRRGSLVIASAGNNAQDPANPNAPMWPAADPNAISVAATRQNGDRAAFSTIGDQNDLAAPGQLITSTYATTTTDYRTMSGTSMAAPHVSAAAAAIWSAHPTAAPAQVRAALETSADDLGDTGWDPSYGHGEINATAALIALDATFGIVPPSPTTPPPVETPPVDPPSVERPPTTTSPTTNPTTPVVVPGYNPVGPVRAFDTRVGGNGYADVPHIALGGTHSIEVQIAGSAGPVPTGQAAAVSMNVTVTNATGPGFVTVYPCGERREVSSVNFADGATVANAVITPLSPTGTVCFYSLVPADIIVDVNGWFASGAGYHPVEPARAFDTRPGGGGYVSVQHSPVGGDNVAEVPLANAAAGIPNTGVVAVSMNVTITNPVAAGFVTVFPCSERRQVSSVNFAAGATVANAVITPLSESGTVCFYSLVPTDIIVDVNGWFETGNKSYTPVDARRLLDTRVGETSLREVANVPVGDGYALSVNVTDLPGVTPAAGVTAVSLNVTATETTGDGFVTVYPCPNRREVSSVNYSKGATVANAVIAPVADDGTICLFSLVPAHLVVDINGWFSPAA